jgi:anti-anti-sigma regulatory factor
VECKIEVADRGRQRVVRLSGRLAEAQVPELLEACAAKTLHIRLHLGDLISVDAVGLDALNRLRRGGAQLVEVPTYIQIKLDASSAGRVHSTGTERRG